MSFTFAKFFFPLKKINREFIAGHARLQRVILESPYTLASASLFLRLPFPPRFPPRPALWTNWYAEVQIEPLSTPARALYPRCNYRECHLSRRYTRGYIRISAGYNAALREIYSRGPIVRNRIVIRQPIKKKLGDIFRESVSNTLPVSPSPTLLIRFSNKPACKNAEDKRGKNEQLEKLSRTKLFEIPLVFVTTAWGPIFFSSF